MNPRTTLLFLLALFLATRPVGASDLSVYDDAVRNDWLDWSWGGVTRDFGATNPLHGGSAAISVTYTTGWSGLKFGRFDSVDVGAYDTFRFHVHGGTAGGQTVQVVLVDSGSGNQVTRTIQPTAGTWTQIDVPLAELGAPASIDDIQWFNATPGSQSQFFLDDVAFVASGQPTPTPVPAGDGPALSVDVTANRHAINPHIYGMNFADEDLATDLRLPVRRFGGNATTRYNWRNDTSNRAADWFFENIPNDNPTPELLPSGSSSDRFVEQNLRTGSDTLLTIPMIGWTPKSRARSCGFSVARYGAQQAVDPWDPDCGNGVSPAGVDIVGNDPTDTSEAISPAFVEDWLEHLLGRFGSADEGGVRFYNLDNEPELWNDTHRDVRPTPLGYDELRDRTIAYATAIKGVDPSAATLGPASWGWSGYFWSALDWSAGGDWWNHPEDRLAHGNVPMVEWYLQQLHAWDQQHGQRLLDYLDLHYYPQASGVALAGPGSGTTQALRLRSTRSLWDPSYVDESWIAEPVRLLPRMREWVASHYPGTRLAIGEYNWGALNHLNGALAQADVLGIFGRERLDLATLWSPPSFAEPGAFAFRMYRNYDGDGGQFGDVGVSATSADPNRLAVYAAERSADGSLTLLVINKDTLPLRSDISISGVAAPGVARVFRYSAANLATIVEQAPQTVATDGFTAEFPASSITLFELAGTRTCGDGQLDNGEQCDDGNTIAGDACDAGCRRELIPATTSRSARAQGSACLVEWAIVNPGNTPALNRLGQRNHVQTCRNDDPTCDRDLEPSGLACAFEMVVCVNNQDPALGSCSANGVSASLRVTKPRATRDPEAAAALAAAFASLRDPLTGETGLGLPVTATQRGLCSQPFTIRVSLRSPRAPAKMRIKTSIESLDGTRRDRDTLTLVCQP